MIRVLLTCAVGMIASGCATPALIKHASKEEVRDHRIAEVTSASRTEDGTIMLCVTGWPAKRGRDKSPVAFSVAFPVSLFENESEVPPVLSGGDDSIASYRLSPERMGKACPKDLADTDAIPVRRVDREYFGAGAPDEQSVAMIKPFIDESEPGAMLYVLGAGDSERSPVLVYRHFDPVFRRSRLLAIRMPVENVKPNKGALAAMPLAVAADAVGVAAVFVVIALATVAAVFAGV